MRKRKYIYINLPKKGRYDIDFCDSKKEMRNPEKARDILRISV